MGMHWLQAEGTVDNFLIYLIRYHLRPDLPQDKDPLFQPAEYLSFLTATDDTSLSEPGRRITLTLSL